MRATHAVAAALALLGVAACSPQEVVLADLPERPDAGGSSGPCVADADCPASSFCARAACGDVGGRCEAAPVLCDGARAPSCGCDGVTYWNDCLRRQGRVTSATPGECTMPAGCGGKDHRVCPVEGAACARVYPRDRCSPGDDRGTCWVLPPTCTGDLGPLLQPCFPAPGTPPGPPPCVDACTAIRSQKPHHALSPSATCP